MTVEIIKAPHINLWYRDKVGETFEVLDYEKDNKFYVLVEQPGGPETLLIHKVHAKEVK